MSQIKEKALFTCFALLLCPRLLVSSLTKAYIVSSLAKAYIYFVHLTGNQRVVL